MFAADDMKVIQTSAQAPRADAICERVIGALRREVFDRMLIYSPQHLQAVLEEYVRITTRIVPIKAAVNVPRNARSGRFAR